MAEMKSPAPAGPGGRAKQITHVPQYRAPVHQLLDRLDAVRKHERWASVDVLRCLAHEAVIVLVAAEATGRGEALTDADRDRLAVAAGRLRAAVEEVANG